MDTTTLIFGIFGLYLAIGLVALVLLDMTTGKIRERLRPASLDVQDKLLTAGSFIGTRTATVFLLLALWIFWPVAIYGAVEKRLKNKRSEDKK